ncbi:MAG: TIGR03013 family PEP-CTERM/XrtA system glycosyltransferase [Acidobacteria bacterium]|nr:TIGR03013 family PEP-CTERM/XrtA system glycosyltransferase [Acidobacteriota bacterium]MBI3661932.1 TIGR03013 family PEP-CTERM/XrtA system glycosyltransferase [Acidobacteriota bacterium]
MVRLFNVYYPARTLVLIAGEGVVVCLSFVVAVIFQLGPDSYIALNYEGGFLKILGVTGLTMLCAYYFDLYDLQRLPSRGETYFRLLMQLATLSFVLAALAMLFPRFLVAQGVFLVGLVILTFALLGWRAVYAWLLRQPLLRERVYVLGGGERAQRLVQALRTRNELGMDVIGWVGAMGNGSLTRDNLANALQPLRDAKAVDRVIVALSDRRGTMPVRELLDLRLSNVKVEEATGLLEKINGKIEVEELHPSWLIFSDGFRLNGSIIFGRRVMSWLISAALLVLVLPLLPLIALLIKLTSPGPVLYKQKRVGRNGHVFFCYKFRTMRPDAEADTGPTWAGDDDPRITKIGRILRSTRLDEIPQLWNVFKGDMGFVGPRPERPEFIEWLSREIPYYNLRHLVRPGITGWAQVSYQYGASLEESREKLQYDLYYIKNISMAFDLYIIFQTVKIVLFGRGAK